MMGYKVDSLLQSIVMGSSQARSQILALFFTSGGCQALILQSMQADERFADYMLDRSETARSILSSTLSLPMTAMLSKSGGLTV